MHIPDGIDVNQKPHPVTTRHMITERASILKPIDTRNSPEAIQL